MVDAVGGMTSLTDLGGVSGVAVAGHVGAHPGLPVTHRGCLGDRSRHHRWLWVCQRWG